MNIIQIAGQSFVVLEQKDIGVKGRVELKMRKPRGRKFFFAVVYENGAISTPVQQP